MNKKKLSHSSLNSSITSVLAALLCILIGLVVGFLVLLAINPAHAWGDGFVRILKGGFHDAPYGVGKELANAAPLIMTGLSVAFAFKTGLFNIGAAGQYTLGAYGALVSFFCSTNTSLRSNQSSICSGKGILQGVCTFPYLSVI